jgi:hypothetical protein
MRMVECGFKQVGCIWLSDSGRKLAATDGRSLRVFDLHADDEPATFAGSLHQRTVIGFTGPDERLEVLDRRHYPPHTLRYLWPEQCGSNPVPVVLSADRTRCYQYTDTGASLTCFTRTGDEWAKAWEKRAKTWFHAPIRVSGDDRLVYLAQIGPTKRDRNPRPYQIVAHDARTGKQVGVSKSLPGLYELLRLTDRHVIAGAKMYGARVESTALRVFDRHDLTADPIELPYKTAHLHALWPDPLGRFLLTGFGTKVVAWDPRTWKRLHALDWKIGTVTCLAVSADGTVAAAGGHQGKVVVWDVE